MMAPNAPHDIVTAEDRTCLGDFGATVESMKSLHFKHTWPNTVSMTLERKGGGEREGGEEGSGVLQWTKEKGESSPVFIRTLL